MTSHRTEGASNRVWLCLDVDGVLNPFVSNREARARNLQRVEAMSATSGWTYSLNPTHWTGEAIMRHPRLSPIWCTTWFEDVDTPAHPCSISEAVGLPQGLPRVDLHYYNDDPHASKTDGILQAIGTDPFVWIDDDPHPGDRARLNALPNRNLFIETDPHIGVTEEDIERAANWAKSLTMSPTPVAIAMNDEP